MQPYDDPARQQRRLERMFIVFIAGAVLIAVIGIGTEWMASRPVLTTGSLAALVLAIVDMVCYWLTTRKRLKAAVFTACSVLLAILLILARDPTIEPFSLAILFGLVIAFAMSNNSKPEHPRRC